MDDYLAKPFDPQRLINVIESQLTRQSRFEEGNTMERDLKTAGVSVDVTESAEVPIDLDTLLRQWGDKGDLVARLLGKFQDALNSDVARIAQAVEAGDFENAGRLAHSLKGGASYVAAEPLRRGALTIEQSARSGDFAGVTRALPALETEAKRCLEAIPAVLTRLQAQEANSV
jgi:HPt (histidine-containing phosphotransfer) domain-containing protein